MIVVDTSAIAAMILDEPDHRLLAAKMLAEEERFVSPISVLEATMVLSRTYSKPKDVLSSYLASARIQICAIDAAQAQFAQEAFLTYGKGRQGARLNLGDCFSYAAAKALNAPLLYIGGDFAKTDIRRA
jgi:ribonuclease VapC